MPSQGQNTDVESHLLDWTLSEGLILYDQHICVMDGPCPGVNLVIRGRRMKLRMVLRDMHQEPRIDMIQ